MMTRPTAAEGATHLAPLRIRRSHDAWLRVLLALIAAIVLVDALIGEQGLSSGRLARRQFVAAGASLSALRDENERMREEVRRLREDPQAIEYVARKDLGLVRPGELVFFLK